MSRDLTRERRPSNGAANIVDAALPSEPDPAPLFALEQAEERAAAPIDTPAKLSSDDLAQHLAPYVAAYLSAHQERRLSAMAAQMIQAAKLLEPITRIAVARCLSLGSLTAAVALAGWLGWLVYQATMGDKAPWALVGCLAVAEAFLLPIIWRGQPKAPPEPSR